MGKHVPFRTCRGCGEKKPKWELIRFVWQCDSIVNDIKGTLPGRGVYCCLNELCQNRLEQNSKVLKRAFRL
jgi:predicted RNA-binding protein YlxR (DUF448 family)